MHPGLKRYGFVEYPKALALEQTGCTGLSECFEVNGYSKKVGGGCEQR